MNNNNLYFRLEIPCCKLDLSDRGYIKQESWYLGTRYVYTENITTIDSLKTRVLYFSELWKKQRLESVYKDYIIERIAFPIFNKWQNFTAVGFCPEGWYFRENSFEIYVRGYLSSTCKDKYSDCLKAIEGNSYDVETFSELNTIESDMHFITEKLMNIELEHFLNGKEIEITEEIKQEVYYPEMVRRGYIDIIDKIK